VSFPKNEAVVTYDPKATTVEKLIHVVANTPNMMGGPMKYQARVHKGK
jgi:hypothetical protein